MTTTPALARATAAMKARDVTEPLRTFYPGAARDAVSAALHDPDNDLARAIYNAGAYCGDCEYLDWDSCDACQQVARVYVVAIRRAILGEGS